MPLPTGVITQYGENLTTNGIILSPDERTLYVTNKDTVAAFDVQPDGITQPPTRVRQTKQAVATAPPSMRQRASMSPRTARRRH